MTQPAPNGESRPSPTGMQDGELLSRLNRLQRELNIIVGEIRARFSAGASKKNQPR
ncbi:hypothetical protein [Microvirga sesbaniae]|nr:hypothetical protein [Microvirga sp. HBU67692]